MLRRPSRVPRSLRVIVLGALVAALGWVIAAGCKEGQPPYQVIPDTGTSDQYLPPGAVLGTSEELGVIYNFNRAVYRLFRPLPETDPRFIRRDSVLAFAAAPDLINPDNDPTLARVYANPKLFGFKASDAAQADVFVEGRKPTFSSSEYLPLEFGNFWEQIHNQREWVVVDNLFDEGSAPTAEAPVPMPAYLMRSTVTARNDVAVYSQPAQYTADQVLTSDPGAGIYYHAWTLISERAVPRAPVGLTWPDRQRNPRFLWLSINSIASFTGNPAAIPPVSIDQCLDNLPAELEQHPVKFAGAQVQEGQIFTTWTYLGVDDAVLRQRLNSESQIPGGGRCGFPIPIGTDTLEMFPTHTFKLLAKYEVRVERILDQVELKIGTQTIGRYPNTPEPESILKLVVRMSVANQTVETPVQYLELYYLRGIGEVIRASGVDPSRRSNARLRTSQVGGTFYPPSNSRYFYSD